MKPTVWILEDEIEVFEIYRDALADKYELMSLVSLADFTHHLNQNKKPDLLIADLRLGDGNFMDLLSEMNPENKFLLPFVVASSVEDMKTLRFCFDKGAIDFLVKPFGLPELYVKIEKALAQTEQTRKANLERLHLTRKEQKILDLFESAPQHQLSREMLMQQIWNGEQVHAKTLDVHLFNLRRKIEQLGMHIEFSQKTGWTLLK